jgi:hypothetical protein
MDRQPQEAEMQAAFDQLADLDGRLLVGELDADGGMKLPELA